MKKVTACGLLVACVLAAGVATAAQKKDKTMIDLKAALADNVAPNKRHETMGSMGERVHGGAFGPWRCQVKMLDRSATNARMKEAGKEGRVPSTHLLSLTIMDPDSAKGVVTGTGTVTVAGPDKQNRQVELQQAGGSFMADIDLPKAGDYSVKIEFASGKQKASAKFSYSAK